MQELVNSLVKKGVLQTKNIIEAFKKVDRADFVPKEVKTSAYQNYPLPIGSGQTISQPATVAFMMELLQPKKGEKILDIGSGSGWTTAMLSFLVGNKGFVLGLERVKELVKFGQDNLRKYQAKFHLNNVKIEKAENKLGNSQNAPYDKILVSASAKSFPTSLFFQLKNGGLMVLPIRKSIWRIRKINNQPVAEEFPGFVFVPLIGEN